MKRILMAMIVLAGAMMLSADMPRSEWHAKVGDCALDPNALKDTISQLSSEDETAFLAEVNAAIDKMPGSAESKAARFLAANRASVAGAGAADRAAVLAEVYATVPPEALTVINEEFAKNEFARPSTMTDAEFTGIVEQTMQKITQRTATAEAGAVRAGFAGLMFIRTAGSATDAVTDAVVASMPAESQGDAKSSWFPSALGKDGGSASYDPMLGAAQAGDEPNHAIVVDINQPQTVDSMLADLQAGSTVGVHGAFGASMYTTANSDDGAGTGISRVPRDRIANPTLPASALTGNPADSGVTVPNPYYTKNRSAKVIEPETYWLQNL